MTEVHIKNPPPDLIGRKDVFTVNSPHKVLAIRTYVNLSSHCHRSSSKFIERLLLGFLHSNWIKNNILVSVSGWISRGLILALPWVINRHFCCIFCMYIQI